ncbi:hypothetical protein F8S09_02720 [Deinococcus sp. SDU3-2]|uniref:Uncharacterized protein n=1 Tax=Deinococcus terrestris TaxID=2651870 RepID=A0A7X1NUI8_9DEIO|nr:hypothetical protein [Deinococcus terrestris]MPY65609.1 hypothetical protein [Deinococcus terrestris]
MKNFTESGAWGGLQHSWLLGVVVALGGLSACGSTPSEPPPATCEVTGTCPPPQPPPASCVVTNTCPPASINEILRSGPRPPKNVNLFPQSVYPTAIAEEIPSGIKTEAQVLVELKKFLSDEFPGDMQAQKEMLNLFNTVKLRQKIGDPLLRAGLISYTAIMQDYRLIDFILNAKTEAGLEKVTNMSFVDYGADEYTPGAEVFVNNQGQMMVTFNKRYRQSSPTSFAELFRHEVFHQDKPVSVWEERIANLDAGATQFYILKTHPALVTDNTILSRVNNLHAALLLNSRSRETGQLDVFAEQGKQLMPGSTLPATRWIDRELIKRNENFAETSPGNALVQARYPMCDMREFNEATLRCVNANVMKVYGLTAEDLIRLMGILELDLDITK